jgi:(1->4)-alpha-D-glucan 1-alpha-D-glucosylmutase
LTTATHDTKRGEDARARINVLSEMPDEWRKQVFVWSRLNSRFRIEFEGEMAPSRNDEYLYYQALIGAWPADAIDEAQTPPGFAGRMKGYMLKAIREAKEHTSWINVRPDYEQGVGHYVEKSLEGPKSQKFLAASREFRKKVARLGAYNSLAQLVLKLGVPGTPDFYQGAELWDLSLVDPYNRRPVDYDLRQRLLSEMEPVLNGSTPADKIAFARTAIEQWHDGRVKMFVTASGLRCRRANSELFLHGDYLPVKSIGERAEHVVAFGRFGGDCAALIVVPRFTSLLPGVSAGRAPAGEECWGATRLVVPRELAGRSFVNVFTGERFELGAEALLGSVLREFPVALLIGK